jgi:hypothetical protein
VIDSDYLLLRLWRTLGFVPPSQRREEEQRRLAEYAAEQQALRRRQEAEALGEELAPVAEFSEERARFFEVRGIPFEEQGDPQEDADSYVQALRDYDDLLVEKERHGEERLAAVMHDESRRSGARRALERVRAERELVDSELSKLWGRTRSTRAVFNGPKDIWDVSDLACRCGCGWLFKDTRLKKAHFGLHPYHLEERRRQASQRQRPKTYAEQLSERLPD